MKLLITSAASRLSRELAAGLSNGHTVTVTDRVPVSTELKFVRSDLGHDATTNDLVRHMDGVIHSVEVDQEATASERLDFAMRCTYNLLRAAADEGVPRLIFLSSLALLDPYDDQFVVTEHWRPLPSTDPRALGYHLGEYVCREFSLERNIEVLVLRLGEMVWNANEPAPPSSALYVDDAVKAVEGAMKADVKDRTLFHIQSAVPNARYITKAAQETLAYKPTKRE